MAEHTLVDPPVSDTTDFSVSPLVDFPLNPAAQLLARLLDNMILLPEEWDEMSGLTRADLMETDRVDDLLPRLVDKQLLTKYQATAVGGGRMADLVIGHYRLLEPIGRGGMGVVYRAEHLHLRRPVALKLMAGGFEDDPRLLSRFFMEARAVARIRHPNIVSCLDAGRHQPVGGGPARSYYVMDLIPGQDLFALLQAEGALPVHRAAGVFRQVAEALAEAHRHRLIHRDIKPGNVFVTPDWQGKLLDFGLALHPHRQMTDPGTLLGTVGYMAPEQAVNPSGVDARADLFSLGASLFLAVSGREPFPETGAAISDLARRLTAAPPRVRQILPELPVDLDELIARLMDPDPERRYPSAAAVAAALTPFQRWRPAPVAVTSTFITSNPSTGTRKGRVLVVDDDPQVRRMIKMLLAGECECEEAVDAEDAWAKLESERFDLAVVDLHLPQMNGVGLLHRVRGNDPANGLMVLLMSGEAPTEALGGLLLDGADDFIQKPFAPPELRSRVRGLLARRLTTESKWLAANARRGAADTMRVAVSDLTRTPAPESDQGSFIPESGIPESSVHQWDLNAAQALASTVSLVLQEGNQVSRGHSTRLPRYLRALAAACPASGEYARLHDEAYLGMLAVVLPMHDLGHLMLPTDVVQKPARLTADERMVVQTHCIAGSEVIVDVAAQFAGALPYLTLAAEVIRGHHERWDGHGYPDMLAGATISLAARMTAVVTVYDALRSRRPYRPSVTHPRAVRMIGEECDGQFDPVLVAAFKLAAPQFDQVYQRHDR